MKYIVFILLLLPGFGMSQRLQLTTKDKTTSEVMVSSFDGTSLTTTTGENIQFKDLSTVQLLDYNHGRDNGLVTALQAAGVKAAMASKRVESGPAPSDSIRMAILEANVENIQINLGKFHRQHQTGVVMSITGIVVTTAGGILSNGKSTVNPLVYVGAAGTLVGTIQIIDSYKYLKRATTKK